MVSKTIPVSDVLSDDVQKFAEEHQVLEWVLEAVRITHEVFSDAERIMVSLKRDPQFGNPYVDINAVIHDDPEIEAEKYSSCIAKWGSFLPPDVDEEIQLSTSWAA